MPNTLMKSPVVVVRHVPSYSLPKFFAVIKQMKIDVLVVYGTPKTLNPNIVLA